MLQDFVADSVRLYDIENDSGIIHNLIFLVDEILGTFLHAVNDSVECELLVNGERVFFAVPFGSILEFLDVAFAWINVECLYARMLGSDTTIFVHFLLDVLVELFDIVHPPAEHLLIGNMHRDRIATFIFLLSQQHSVCFLIEFQVLDQINRELHRFVDNSTTLTFGTTLL